MLVVGIDDVGTRKLQGISIPKLTCSSCHYGQP